MALTQISTQGIKDGTITGTDLATNIDLVDNQKLRLGTNSDFEIYHASDVSFIKAAANDQLQLASDLTWLRNAANSQSLAKFTAGGAAELYYANSKKFETTSYGAKTSGELEIDSGHLRGDSTNGLRLFSDSTATTGITLTTDDDLVPQTNNAQDLGTSSLRYRSIFASNALDMVDNAKVQLGNSDDLQIYHDGTSSYISNTTGNLYITATSTETAIQIIPNGAVDLRYDGSKKLETTANGVELVGNLHFHDSEYALFGNANDLQIYHTGSHSIIRDAGTGNLQIAGSFIQFTNAAITSTGLTFNEGGAVELYFDNTKRFETNNTGAFCTGELGCDTLYMGDNEKAKFGNNDDLQIYHDSVNNNIRGTGNHLMRFWTNDTIRWNILNDGHFRPEADNSYDIGASNQRVRSIFASNALDMADNAKVQLGNSDDLQIYHDGTNNYIDGTTGYLFIRGDGTNSVHIKPKSNEESIVAKPDGAVELYYDNSKQFETTADGVDVQGNITIASANNAPKITFDENGANDPKAEIQMDQVDGNNGHLIFKTEGSGTLAERMRINSDGDVFVGTTTTNPGFGTNSDPGHYINHVGYAMHSRDNGTALFIARNDNTGSLVSFNYTGGGQIADISTNGSSVSYNTGSDYRLKENITTLTNAITRLKKLKPSRFNFLTTPSITQDGFIAHEVQEVVPEAVTGVKDEVRTEDGDMGEKTGDPVMQSLDVAKLVPLLTAGLQEAISKIELLETEVAALKAG